MILNVSTLFDSNDSGSAIIEILVEDTYNPNTIYKNKLECLTFYGSENNKRFYLDTIK